MDFYAPQVMWIKQQKKIEKKLFDELLTNARGTCSWEYKLNYIEKELKYNHINEWEFKQKMDELKSEFESFNSDDSDEEYEALNITSADGELSEASVTALEEGLGVVLAHFDNIHYGNYLVVDTNLPEGQVNYTKFHRQSDAEIYFRDLLFNYRYP